MAKFRYRMQNILNIKEKLEMQAKNEYAAANMELLEEQERLSVMLQENAALQEEGRKLRQKESLSIRDIADNSLSVSLMKEKMKRQALAIHRAEQKVEEKRKAMTDLMLSISRNLILICIQNIIFLFLQCIYYFI